MATLVLLLLYVIAPALLLVGNVVTLKDASPYVFLSDTENVLAERVDVATATMSVLLVLVAPAYWPVAAWVAVNVVSPTPTSVIKLPDAVIVATPVLLLLYVIAPLLLLVGNVATLNAASPYIFVLATVNVLAEKVDVARRATVRVLLVLVVLVNFPATAAWVAVNVTLPAPTSVIKLSDASIVATPGLLLLYVIAPLLLLVSNVKLNAASPIVFVLATVNVPIVGSGRVLTVRRELTLLVT